ncbi:MAG: DUF2017 domain-containing protein [Actinomycetota bacterium]|nr:DUF2017 domain-containing protein [Actinomycetota bacterium]
MVRLESAGSGIALMLETDEAVVVGRLLDDMIEFLSAENPDDAIEERLFPSAYDDDAEAKKFTDMVGDELRSTKMKNFEVMRAGIDHSGGRTILTPDDVETWLRGLTDLRLALGTRLEVTEEKMARIPEADDPEAPALGLLHWMAWLQEMLIDSLSEREDGDDKTDEGNGSS